MYSGQGSGYYTMGGPLYSQSSVFREWLQLGDTILKDHHYPSLIESLYLTHRSHVPFDNINISHPGIAIVQFAASKVLEAEGIVPGAVWGNSLGELTASTISGRIDFETMVETSVHQLNALRSACEPGGVLTILGETSLYGEVEEFTQCELAGVNFSKHFSIAGAASLISKAEKAAKELKIPYWLLPVNFGFHSSAIDPARAAMLKWNSLITVNKAKCEYISSAQENYINYFPYDHFWDAIRKPLLFQKTLEQVYDPAKFYIDLGPTGTLATFFKYNLPAYAPQNWMMTMHPSRTDCLWLQELRSKLLNCKAIV